jgi:hypothetical protein
MMQRETDNSSRTNAKEKYMNLYDKIIDIFVEEIQEKFKPSNLEPILELFKVIMIEEIKTKINFDILNIYENLVNLHDLKLEMPSYIRYKQLNNTISWRDFDILLKEFNQKDLKVPFRQIFLVIKLYLTIPTSTCEGERCFSVLNSFLRPTMTNARLSDLAILKIANDNNINYDEIIILLLIFETDN